MSPAAVARRTTAAACLALLIAAEPSSAQLPAVRGYYLNVPLWSESTPLVVGGIGDLQRLRLMTEPSLGPVDIEIAYEHLLNYSEKAVSRPVGAIIGGLAPGGGEWLDLQWTIEETDHWLWRHRFDRLNARISIADLAELTAGRQTISWATTLFLTPADPFIPFDPADPFREYRAGVDAVRLQIYPGPLSDLDFVVRPEKSAGETLTVLARGRTTWRNWELSAWLGSLYDSPAAAIGGAGSLGATALRGELSFREDDNGKFAVRGTLGLDRRYDLFDRDLYVVLEYQHDDFAASGANELLGVIGSDAFARGELQVLGADELAGQVSYQAHPLLDTSLLLLWSLSDWSALLGPGAAYSLSNEVTVQGGLFLGLGNDDFTPPGGLTPPSGAVAGLPSEFGITPAVVWLSLTAFF